MSSKTDNTSEHSNNGDASNDGSDGDNRNTTDGSNGDNRNTTDGSNDDNRNTTDESNIDNENSETSSEGDDIKIDYSCLTESKKEFDDIAATSGDITAPTCDSDDNSRKRGEHQNTDSTSDDELYYDELPDDENAYRRRAPAPTSVADSSRRPRKDSTFSAFSAGTIRLQSETQRQLMQLLVTGQSQNYPGDSRRDVTRVEPTHELPDALKRRLRDFRFAQKKRVEKYGQQLPWGIIGLYDHLTGIRTDVEWAEDAAWRRENEEPYLSWADFEEAKDTGLNRPFFTYGVMFVCTCCLIVSIAMNGWSVEPLSVNPMIGPSAQTLIAVGAKQTSLIVEKNEWFRLFTPMVLHAGIIHYFVNMLALWFIGYAVEQSHGFVASAILFMIPAVGGTIISALFLPEYISVGASGGIFGLIGACLADICSNWNLLFSKEVNNSDEGTRFRHIKVLLWLFLDILLNILIGLTPFVDNFTHMGGMLYGFLCGLSTMKMLSKAFFGVKVHCSFEILLIRFFGIILSLILIIVSLVILANSDGTKSSCRACRFVSCVPFPFWRPYDEKWWYCDDCDLVTADARQNKDTMYYSSLNLTCPDGEVEYVDLTNGLISDRDWLRKQLPNYCREYCNELYSN